jgi:hypothetical protein
VALYALADTFSFTTSKGFFKDKAHVQLGTPAKAFGKWQ